MTTAGAWRSEGVAVAAATGRVTAFELGLHFNLTEGGPLSPDLARDWPALPRLERLIVLAHLGRLPLAAIAVELRAQLDAFSDAVGRAPDFIDGHQHVHHLPGVRRLVLDVPLSGPPAVRNTGRVVGPGHAVKRMLIEQTGGQALQRLLRERKRRHNDALLGVYDFRGDDYRSLMRGWLAAAPASGGLVFCHPNHATAGATDPIGEARSHEAVYFAGTAFADDLAEAGVSVAAAWPRSSSAG